MKELLMKLDEKFKAEFGEDLINNSQEAIKMAEFVLDVYKNLSLVK